MVVGRVKALHPSTRLTVCACQGQRAQRIEMLLLHEFHRQKFLLPDKLRAKDRERLAKAAAALVEPKSEDNVDDEQEKPGGLSMQT